MSESASPPSRSNVALIISLCVNLLLAGIIVTAVVRFAMHGPWFGQRMPDPLGASVERAELHQMLSPRLLMHIAPDKADNIRNIIDTHRARIDALRANSMAERRHVMDVFGAPTFDKVAFGKALARMRAADSVFEAEILQVVSETADTLTPEERQKAAAWRGRGHGFGHGMGWGHGRGHGRGNGGPPSGGEPPAK
jgi:uncharacterized membrane protein